MKDFTLGTQSVATSSASLSADDQDFHPLDLPLELRLKESEEQLEYLLLASILLLYRSSGGSDRAKFTWGFYENSTPSTQVAAGLTDVIPDDKQNTIDILHAIRALRQKQQNTNILTGQYALRWEEQHMFFAATHPTGQPAPHVRPWILFKSFAMF